MPVTPAHDEEQHAVGRRDQADHDVDHDDDAEMHEVDAERPHGRDEDRDDHEEMRAWRRAGSRGSGTAG